ncbi:pentapeptide MXKDX repeat protein [Luteibacter yeojuensis]|uniref:pentapeptide MXKDX repeat protein n=1 Tax=Luteibacter yeojuensis TaxID=345309 RepID=UPI001878780C|nr:pentapeptide MXKDX repeat protein [Luteibacter yeojuensis]
MRNTKLIVAMLAGCMTMSGAVLAQDASQATPTSSSTAAMKKGGDSMGHDSMGHDSMSHDSMKKGGDSMSHDSMKKGEDSMSHDAMKSTHKTHKMKKDDSMSAPAKSSTSGM